jgi:hypothetical protein
VSIKLPKPISVPSVVTCDEYIPAAISDVTPCVSVLFCGDRLIPHLGIPGNCVNKNLENLRKVLIEF